MLFSSARATQAFQCKQHRTRLKTPEEMFNINTLRFTLKPFRKEETKCTQTRSAKSQSTKLSAYRIFWPPISFFNNQVKAAEEISTFAICKECKCLTLLELLSNSNQTHTTAHAVASQVQAHVRTVCVHVFIVHVLIVWKELHKAPRLDPWIDTCTAQHRYVQGTNRLRTAQLKAAI